MNNNLSDSDFYKIQDSFRKHQGEYNLYIEKIERQKEQKGLFSLWSWIRSFFGF